MFRQILENEITKRKISVRDAAREIGISHTTLIAARDGTRRVDMDTALAIARWAGVPLSTIVMEADPVTYKDNALIQAILMVIEAAPDLKEVFVNAAEELQNGTLTMGDFRDIVEYAGYKIRTRKEQKGKV